MTTPTKKKAEGAWQDGWRSGFCCIGHCEGTKPRGALSDRPMKVCTLWESCRCECHERITLMFKSVGMERQVQDNPDYMPEPPTWVMPSPEERAAAKAEVEAAKKQVIIVPSAVPDLLPPTAIRTYVETPSGQRQRGQLEDEVKLATDAWTGMNSAIPGLEPCTTKWIANFIDSDNPPSTGAITEVLKRWVQYGFATMGDKPVRFSGYTSEGVKQGLPVMRAAYKDRKRQMERNISKGRR